MPIGEGAGGEVNNFLIYEGIGKKEGGGGVAGFFEGGLIPQCTDTHTHTHTHTHACTHARTHKHTQKTHMYIYIYIYQ